MRLTGMKPITVNLLRAVALGLVALAISFSLLERAGVVCAVLIRRQWPEAWFSGLIVWYAEFLAAGLSLTIAVLIGRCAARRWRAE